MLFHTSSLFLVLVYLLTNNRLRLVYLFGVIFLISIALFYFWQKISDSFQFLSLYSELYQIYETEDYDIRNLGLGMVLNILIMISLVFIFLKNDFSLYRVPVIVIFLSLLLIPISFFNPMVVRLNFYLLPLLIFIFPYSFQLIKNPLFRVAFMSTIILFTLYGFITSHFSVIYNKAYGSYSTFLTSDLFVQSILY